MYYNVILIITFLNEYFFLSSLIVSILAIHIMLQNYIISNIHLMLASLYMFRRFAIAPVNAACISSNSLLKENISLCFTISLAFLPQTRYIGYLYCVVSKRENFQIYNTWENPERLKWTRAKTIFLRHKIIKVVPCGC